MKRRVRVITGAVVGSALALGNALPAMAGIGTAESESGKWAMAVRIQDYTWQNPNSSDCEEAPVDVATEGWGADYWALDADVRPAGSSTPVTGLLAESDADPGENVDAYVWTTTLELCPGFAPGSYLMEGTAYYGLESDYEDADEGLAAVATSFKLAKMTSTTTLNPVKSDGKTAVVSGKVVGSSSTGQAGAPKQVGVAKQKVTVQRLVNGAWQNVATTTTNASGNFSVVVSGATAAVPYRVVYGGSQKVAASTSAKVTATVPKPKPTVSAKAVSKKGKLKVDVNPNKGKGYWTFTVEKKAGSKWVPQKTYRTEGSKETKTVNLPKGTYRVKVNAKYGYASTYSAPVTLVK